MIYAGAVFQSVPTSLQDYWGAPDEGAYITLCFSGAPCRRDKLSPTKRVVAVNERPVSSLEGLAQILKEETGVLRFRVIDLKGRSAITPVRADTHYWPTAWLYHGDQGWQYETWQ